MTLVRSKTWIGAVALLLGFGAAGACSSHVMTAGGSETNWLDMCSDDGDCSVGHCVCGVCSEACERGDVCPTALDTCVGRTSVAFGRFCGSAVGAPSGICSKACGDDAPCGRGFQCDDGVCVPAPKGGDDAGATNGGDASSGGGTSGSGGARGTAGGTGQAGSGPLQTSTTTDIFVDVLGYLQETPVEALNGECFPGMLHVDADGGVGCSLVAATTPPTCSCDQPGYHMPADGIATATLARLRSYRDCDTDGKPACSDVCLCELDQASGSDLTSCQSETAAPAKTEWCYVDPGQGAGDQAVVARCPATSPRMLRILGLKGTGTLAIACTQVYEYPADTTVTPGNVGDACTPSEEGSTRFSGFAETEVNVETGSPSCNTGVCLVANFRGRVSCPYGQADNGMVDANGLLEVDPAVKQRCMTTGPNPVLVDVPVRPQLIARPPEKAVYCSCRCDGPGPGPFCACPDGFVCQKLVDDYGTSTSSEVAGSYCIKAGTEVTDPTTLQNSATCNPAMHTARPIGCGP